MPSNAESFVFLNRQALSKEPEVSPACGAPKQVELSKGQLKKQKEKRAKTRKNMREVLSEFLQCFHGYESVQAQLSNEVQTEAVLEQIVTGLMEPVVVQETERQVMQERLLAMGADQDFLRRLLVQSLPVNVASQFMTQAERDEVPDPDQAGEECTFCMMPILFSDEHATTLSCCRGAPAVCRACRIEQGQLHAHPISHDPARLRNRAAEWSLEVLSFFSPSPPVSEAEVMAMNPPPLPAAEGPGEGGAG